MSQVGNMRFRPWWDGRCAFSRNALSKMGTATGAQRAPPVPSNDDPMGSSALGVLRAERSGARFERITPIIGDAIPAAGLVGWDLSQGICDTRYVSWQRARALP